MASIRKEFKVSATAGQAWEAMRDIGALHTRLVPGFVVDTKLEPGCRVVTFANGHVAREKIVSIDDDARRLVWSAIGDLLTHHNGSTQMFAEPGGGTRIVWITDFLPDSATEIIDGMLNHAVSAMKTALDRLP
jgi:hypothetical protein